ncbi:hypothetical protein K440DRAFT_679764 [Wilcoxina mikolae CBS 423.85]|nr:hypothetical protein K440DRAFT_679764 [Wilcoxina mikolae CBS 423.85]
MHVHLLTLLLLVTGALATEQPPHGANIAPHRPRAEPSPQPSDGGTIPQPRRRAEPSAQPSNGDGGTIPRHRPRAEPSPQPSDGGTILHHRPRAEPSPQPSNGGTIPRHYPRTTHGCKLFQIYATPLNNPGEYRGTPTCCCDCELCNVVDDIDGYIASAKLDKGLEGTFTIRNRGGQEWVGYLEHGGTTWSVKGLGEC